MTQLRNRKERPTLKKHVKTGRVLSPQKKEHMEMERKGKLHLKLSIFFPEPKIHMPWRRRAANLHVTNLTAKAQPNEKGQI